MPPDATAAFAEAMGGGDVERAVGLLDDGVVFHSPIVHGPYLGREPVAGILRAVVVVFEDFSYTARYDATDGSVLAFRARVGDRELDGVDIIRLSPEGLIAELTVMVRPLSAATALQARMAAALDS